MSLLEGTASVALGYVSQSGGILGGIFSNYAAQALRK